MNNRERITRAMEYLSGSVGAIGKKQATVGFDGCLDVIYRVLKSVNSSGSQRVFFSTMDDFGSHIMEKSGISCSLELSRQVDKIGGNGPILSNALGHLGVKTNVIGTLGYPQVNGRFKEMSPNCSLFSYDAVNETTALEFNDGKVLLYPGTRLEGDMWEKITGILGKDQFYGLLFDVDLLGLVNWSELEYSMDLWRKLYDEVSNTEGRGKSQILFIDLSDCSRRDVRSIREIAGLIRDFGKYFKVVLSLNENEAMVLSKAVKGIGTSEPEEACRRLCAAVDADTTVIHTAKKSFVCTSGGIFSSMETYYNKAPQISTGAGDNFNAGFALGCLLGLPAEVCEVLGNSAASYYLTFGHSPTAKSLMEHMESWAEALK